MRIVEGFRNIFKIAELRNRVLFTFGMLIVFRIGSHITCPGINPAGIEAFKKSAENTMGSLWHMVQIFSGGALGNLALFSLGIMPYITSSIIMQLMTKVSPTLEAIVKEGPSGQRKIGQYTRYLAVPICVVQAIFAVQSLTRQQGIEGTSLLVSPGFWTGFEMMVALAAGSMFIMWLGEQITERGIGNGASVLIMAGIVAQLPAVGGDLIERVGTGEFGADALLLMTAIYVGTIAGVVYVTQAQRRIPIQHAKHFRGRRVMSGARNYLPLRVNTAGVMPVIFASSLLIIPQLIGSVEALKFVNEAFLPGRFFYTLFYVVTIFFFSYFWTYLFFPPTELANNLKEYGSFIPGLRPGENTANYLNGIIARITLAGAAFLALIALMPDLLSVALGMNRYLVQFMGGTGILIVVGVSLDIIQKIESYLLMHHYEGFVGGSGIRGRR